MTTTITTSPTNSFDTGRDMYADVLIRQIGFMNLAAISGGRALKAGRSAVVLPVAHGYAVRIILDADDTYTVQRIFTRGAKTWLHGERKGVYADEVGEAAYYASCYVSYDAKEWVAK